MEEKEGHPYPNMDFRLLPEWRADEVIEEMDEASRTRLVTELKRRKGAGEHMYYAEVPVEGGPAETIGVGSWKVRSWPRLPGEKETAGLIEISFIHVKPGARGKGVGKAILDHALEEAGAHFTSIGSKLRKAYALVSSRNEKGLAAYKRWGFMEEAKLEKHFSEDFDMIVMSRFFP